MYQKQIEQLVVLQHLDEEIEVLEAELEAAPQELATLEQRYQAISSQQAQVQEKAEHLKEQKKRLSSEIEEDNLKIKKSKNKLMMASNTREYHAMMREMDNMEKLNRLREEESMTLSEELSRQDQAMEQLNSTAKELEEELESHRANLQERLNTAQAKLDDLKNSRAESGKIVPAPILARYEFIRNRLHNPVIVSVAEGVCTGCNISIPPQTFNELQRGQQIHSCPNCQRLIYWEQHGPAQSEQKEASEAEA
ncbi:zinc ribbon domain-containing protein [Desulfohalovibrio reitneri]|uniref:zinc ribbon domain-containing protein n=1 Tax=Desulfohalovibrio reitneri TaxID=1307759 RepID=UPI0004A7540B|nr:C4-type zinc ribbon domain-containing protein [Desulfohalovibrio reitneri]